MNELSPQIDCLRCYIIIIIIFFRCLLLSLLLLFWRENSKSFHLQTEIKGNSRIHHYNTYSYLHKHKMEYISHTRARTHTKTAILFMPLHLDLVKSSICMRVFKETILIVRNLSCIQSQQAIDSTLFRMGNTNNQCGQVQVACKKTNTHTDTNTHTYTRTFTFFS